MEGKRMEKTLSSLNSFLKYISNHKVWAFASSVFVACFWFSINTYVTAPNEWLELNQRKNNLDGFVLEWTVIDAIHGHVIDALEKTQETQNTYMEFRKEVTKEQKVPERQVVLDYYLKIMELNNEVTRIIGNLDSLRSNNAEIDGYAKEFSTDLKEYQVTFDEMENVLVAILDGDDTAAFEHVMAQTQSMIQMPIYLEKTMNRFQGFELEIDNLYKTTLAAQETLLNDTKLFFRKIYLAIASAIYMLIFGVVASRKWYLRSHRRQSPKAIKKKKR